MANLIDQKKSVDGEGGGTPVSTPGATPKRKRRKPFEVELHRKGEHWRTLGLLVSPDDDPRYLIVDDIWEPSLISVWNANAKNENMKVRLGDVITAVDGSSSSG